MAVQPRRRAPKSQTPSHCTLQRVAAHRLHTKIQKIKRSTTGECSCASVRDLAAPSEWLTVPRDWPCEMTGPNCRHYGRTGKKTWKSVPREATGIQGVPRESVQLQRPSVYIVVTYGCFSFFAYLMTISQLRKP